MTTGEEYFNLFLMFLHCDRHLSMKLAVSARVAGSEQST